MTDFGPQDRSDFEAFWGIFAKQPDGGGNRLYNIITFYPQLIEWLATFAISRALMWGITYVALLAVLVQLIPQLPLFALLWLVATAPIWAPIALVLGAWFMHLRYKHAEYLASRHTILLELKVPREIHKSPRAMEIAINQLHQTGGETTFIQRWWKGQVRMWYSLEIVSLGGNIHYYIWTWKDFRSIIETAFYSQFPEMEIVEVDDYATRFDFDPKKHIGWATDYQLAHLGEDKLLKKYQTILPLKSYIDFELEHSHTGAATPDPLSYVIEYMASIKPDEQMWMQILIRGTSRDVTYVSPFVYKQTWSWLHHLAADAIRTEALTIPGQLKPTLTEPRFTPRMQEQLTALDRNGAKRPFDFMCRGVYLSTPKSYHGPTVPGLRLIWRPFGTLWLGSLEPARWFNGFNYPWEDFRNMRKDLMIKRFLDAYRRRSAFYPPWKMPYNYVTAETLATLFHFLPQSVSTPGLDRVWNTKVEPPLNLPT